MTEQELIDFENHIVELFESKQILAPVHLDNGNEKQLIEIFKEVQPQDWVCGTWRMHYKCLLKGVPKQQLINKIKEGKSISLCFPEYKIISSAIVGGIIPIALGLAMAAKMSNKEERVWCCIGETGAETGTFHECLKYATNHDLPITFILENNFKSVCTPTFDIWNISESTYKNHPKIRYFEYTSKFPHAGGLARVNF